MAKARIAAYTCAALLMMLAAFAVQGNLLESSVANSLLPTKAQKIASFEAVVTAASAEKLAKSTTGQLYAAGRLSFQKLEPLPPEFVDEETLWLARCIFSETKRPTEQELVAWVVRNRVETAYRGKTSYREVVLDPMQFSAFNPGGRKRAYYSALSPTSRVPGWQTALRIAHDVRWADETSWRPFSPRTRHFYSEQSMVGQRHPDWSQGFAPVSPARDYSIDARRFRFYEGVN